MRGSLKNSARKRRTADLVGASGAKRFKDFQAKLGAPPKTLSARLKNLVSLGILERHSFNEIPPRVEYSLTTRGRDMKSFFEELGKWHMKYSTRPVRR